MFKYTLAATLDEMDREGITVAECPLRSMRCLSLQNGRIVGINTARFDSSAEVRTALIHEDGHFASGAFYLPYSPYQLKAQAEYRADKAAVLKHIPYTELAARLRRGDTLADAAEYFCVTAKPMLCTAIWDIALGPRKKRNHDCIRQILGNDEAVRGKHLYTDQPLQHQQRHH